MTRSLHFDYYTKATDIFKIGDIVRIENKGTAHGGIGKIVSKNATCVTLELCIQLDKYHGVGSILSFVYATSLQRIAVDDSGHYEGNHHVGQELPL